jgi:hypothetical protein
METALRDTLDDIFTSDAAKSHPRFDFYLVSYAKFFNADTTACNDYWFQPEFEVDPVTNLPDEHSIALLVQPLRKEMNDAIDQVNQLYVSSISTLLYVVLRKKDSLDSSCPASERCLNVI